ncbi:MAG: hypothetical protein ACO1ON_15055, partial [Nocardioides sp.]
LVPAQLAPRRPPASVTDAELAEAGAEVIAGLLGDVRALRSELRDAGGRASHAGVAGGVRDAVSRRLRARRSRSR